MHYTYILFSELDGKLYTGTTSDLRARLKLHNAGRVKSTAHRRPLRLLYYECRSNYFRQTTGSPPRTREYAAPARGTFGELERHEACLSADDAYRRERYLKSGRGGRYLRTRLASSLPKIRGNKLERY